MNFNVFSEKVLDLFRNLEGTVEYRTSKYIGFKINSKMYAEVTVSSDHVKALLNSKYIDEDDIKKLNINVLPENYKWILNGEIKIYESSDLDECFRVIKICYENTKQEYDDKIKNSIYLSISNNDKYIKPYMEMEEFAFQKLIDKWDEFINYNISNSSLDEIKSDIDVLDKFSSNDILNRYKNDEVKYNLLVLINEVVSYVDKNAYNKHIYNQYEDKRTLALTFVRQNDWVKNLINYKKYKDLTKVTEVIRNVIMYINNPSNSLSGFKTSKLKQFLKLLSPSKVLDDNYGYICENISNELNKYNIPVVNEKNRGLVYGIIMFSKEMAKQWDKENNYLKLQPYKVKGLSRKEIDEKLHNNLFVSNDASIVERPNNKNIFYAVDESKILFLGVFTEEITIEDGVYTRGFIKLKEVTGWVDKLPKDKAWGSKFSSKVVIRVKEDEKQKFESDVLNGIFDTDIDELLEGIKYEVPENKRFVVEEEPMDIEVMEEVVFEKEIETPLNMILYGPPGTGKTYNTVNYAVSIVEKKEIDEVVNEAKKDRQSVFNRYKKYLAEKKIVFTTFHQNYSYEDFIQGIRANTNNTDQLSFIKQDGIFKDLVERAKNDLGNYYIMVIDEINRGNISRIFGELITLIEDDKRLGMLNETTVTLPSKEGFGVPPNVFILGTMNTADKSIANIDIALRRRFDFIPMFTDYSVIPEFEHILRPINNRIYEKKRSGDYMIGHAFFVNKTIDDIGDIVNRKLIPLLNEYFYLDTNEVKDILNRGGIKVKENLDNFQLEFDRVEE